MAISGMQAYDLDCKSCGWHETTAKRKSIDVADKVLSYFQKKCPKCGEKITVTKNDNVVF